MSLGTLDVDGHLVFLFISLSLLLGLLIRQLCFYYRLPIPYEVLLLISGVLLGLFLLLDDGSHANNDLVSSLYLFATINPSLLLYVFLPILLFDSAFTINFRTLTLTIAPTLLLSIPGVVIIAFLTGALLLALFPYGWDLLTCLLLGAILSATDPVSTVAILKEVGAFEKVTTIIEAESLLNDGSAFVLYSLFLNILLASNSTSVEGESASFSVGGEVGNVIRESVGGPLFGWVSAIVSSFLLSRVTHHTAVEVTGTVLAAYFSYVIATAYIGTSGILSIVVLGIFMGRWRNGALSPPVHHALLHVWAWLVYMANTLLFVLSGVIVCKFFFLSSDWEGSDFGYCFLLYLILQVTRFAAVGLLYPVVKAFGYRMSWREMLMMGFSGLRGTVSLMLALITGQQTGLKSKVSEKLIFHTAGIVLLSNVINGTACRFLVRWLRLNEDNVEDQIVMRQAVRRLRESVDGEMREMKTKAEFAAVEEWEASLVSSTLHSAIAPVHTSPVTVTLSQWEAVLTIRCLNSLKLHYQRLYSQGLLRVVALDQLTAACDQAVDKGDFGAFASSISTFLRVPWWIVRGFESSMLAQVPVLHHRVEGWLHAHYLHCLELTMTVTASLGLCNSVIDAYTGVDHVGELVSGQVREAIGEYKSQLNVEVEDLIRAYPLLARELQHRRAFLALNAFQQSRVRALHEHGLLTERQWKGMAEEVQEELQTLDRCSLVKGHSFSHHLIHSSQLFSCVDTGQRAPLMREGERRLLQVGSRLNSLGANDRSVWLVVRGIVSVEFDDFPHMATSQFGSLQICTVERPSALPVPSSERHLDEEEDHSSSSTMKLCENSMVGVYTAMTGRPALFTCSALTAVEAFVLPPGVLPQLIEQAKTFDLLWRRAASEIIVAFFPFLLHSHRFSSCFPQSPSDPLSTAIDPPLDDFDCARLAVASSDLLSEASMPSRWHVGRFSALLLLHGTLLLSPKKEELNVHRTLHSPCLLTEMDVEELKSGPLYIKGSRDVRALLWRTTATLGVTTREGQHEEAVVESGDGLLSSWDREEEMVSMTETTWPREDVVWHSAAKQADVVESKSDGAVEASTVAKAIEMTSLRVLASQSALLP